MTHDPPTIHSLDAAAYLVIRSGPGRGEVFRLPSNQVTTIGRAPTNRVVVSDEVCSRHHCEMFFSAGSWTLRDLGSRNGTRMQDRAIQGDVKLRAGQTFRIGNTQFGFTDDLSRPFVEDEGEIPVESDTAVDGTHEGPVDGGKTSNPEILHRRQQTRYEAPESLPATSREEVSRGLARLYRLALEMGQAKTPTALADVVLDALLKGSSANIGAILLNPPKLWSKPPQPDQLSVVAYRSDSQQPYQRVSDFLSRVVLTDRTAVLARDVTSDKDLADRDSLGEIQAQSVICAPIRTQDAICGLVHLYSTDLGNALDVDDLEFTLAVADQMASALAQLAQLEVLQAGMERIETENQTLREHLHAELELVGESPPMQKLRAKISRIAPTDATVLIRGESGVGKELIARAIHLQSNRRSGPFVTMNCAALAESLLESELFGHEKGSFTGAFARKFGKFEQAHQGTLFLDEVGEMSPAVQAKFLRVLEGHEFERVWGGTAIHVDTRVVAATNRDLEKAVNGGEFRRDLYFRLQVLEVSIEPLRERKADIPLLANYFLNRSARKLGRTMVGFTPLALQTLVDHDWPGNIRELQHTVERAVILCPNEAVGHADLHLSSLRDGLTPREEQAQISAPAREAFQATPLEVVEQQHILATLEWTNWNKSQAAQILGIERSTLDRKLKRYEVERPKSGG